VERKGKREEIENRGGTKVGTRVASESSQEAVNARQASAQSTRNHHHRLRQTRPSAATARLSTSRGNVATSRRDSKVASLAPLAPPPLASVLKVASPQLRPHQRASSTRASKYLFRVVSWEVRLVGGKAGWGGWCCSGRVGGCLAGC